MRRARSTAVLGALLLLAACAAAPRAAHAPDHAGEGSATDTRTFTLGDRDVEEIVRDTSAARQLGPKRPVAVERLEQRRFVERLLGGRERTARSGGLTPGAAFLLGFDFVPAPAERAGIASTSEVLEEQVVGFYERPADRVFIPDLHLHSEDDLLQQEAVLAHEVHHALQAQHFPEMPVAASSDEALAQLSLIEGDAQVAMGAWLGARAGAPVGRTLRRIVEVTKRVPVATVSRGEQTRRLDHALDHTRKHLEFPYEAGMLLVSDVYRAGGFPLVNKMYASPPRSTEQVLHPEKYLAGESPRPIGDPRPLAGYTVAHVDTLGELDTRILLSRCFDEKTAERAAAGWAGDRFGVFVGPERRLALAWVSAWDSARDADEFEAALAKSQGCWHDNALGLPDSDFTIGASLHVRRQGNLVAFLRGFPPAARSSAVQQLFSMVGPEPKPKPLTDLKIPPRVHLPEPAPGHLEGDVYRNEWLGVVGRVPQGMVGRAGGEVDFFVERPGVLVEGAMAVSTRITSDEQNEKAFREVQESFVREAGKLSLQVQALGGGRVQTALGAGVERSWRVAGTWIELRLILVPICAGTGSIVFVESYGDPYARSVLDGWIESFRWIHGRNLTACDFLDPK